MSLLESPAGAPAPPAARPARRSARRPAPPPRLRAADAGRRIDATTVLIVLAWAYVVLPRLVQSIVAPKFRLSVGEDASMAPAAHAVELLLLGALLVWCVGAVLVRCGRLPTDRRVGLLVLLVPWIYVVCRDLYLHQRPALTGVLWPLVAVALWACRPRLERLAAIGVLTGVTAVLSLGLAIVDPTKGILSHASGDIVAAEKALLPMGLLIGPFQNGNNLGRILALGLPFLGLVRGWRARVALGVPIVVALVASSSRSSIAAAAVGVLLAVVLLRLRTGGRAPVAVAVTGGLLAVVGVLPLVTTDPAAFTNRGLVWAESLRRWAQNPVVGLGSNWYTRAAQVDENIATTAYHGHNQFVHIATTGGLVGLACVLLLLGYLVAIAARWADTGSVVPATFVAALLVSSIQEVNIGFVDRTSMLASAALGIIGVLMAVRPSRPAEPGPEVRSGRRPTRRPPRRS